jgi:hypothetical protein
MHRISQFLQAVVTHWGVLVTGGFAIGVLGIWQGTGHQVRPWVYWIVAIIGLFLAFFKAWNDQVNEKEQALTKVNEIRKEFEASEARLQEVLNAKPKISCQFEYGGQEAILSVTNTGTIAQVWASLRVRGMVRSGAGPFARWTHSSSFKTKIAKGETYHLALAGLRIQNGSISTWVVFFATETDVGMREALQSSLVQARDDGQADDIDLYIKLFSDPECLDLPKEWHVILHSNEAELGN